MVHELNKLVALGLEPLLIAEGFKRMKRGAGIAGFPARETVARFERASADGTHAVEIIQDRARGPFSVFLFAVFRDASRLVKELNCGERYNTSMKLTPPSVDRHFWHDGREKNLAPDAAIVVEAYRSQGPPWFATEGTWAGHCARLCAEDERSADTRHQAVLAALTEGDRELAQARLNRLAPGLWELADAPAFAERCGLRHPRPEEKPLCEEGRRLLSPERIEALQPEALVSHLGLDPASVVADIGAGPGLLTLHLARAVPRGRVLATDQRAHLVAATTSRARAAGLTNVETSLMTWVHSPQFEKQSLDLAMLCDDFQRIGMKEDYFKALVETLRPGGRIAVVDNAKCGYQLENLARAVPLRELGSWPLSPTHTLWLWQPIQRAQQA